MQFNFKNKKVLVMGLGLHGGGRDAVEFLLREGARITVTDLRSKIELRESIKKLSRFKNVRWVLGKHRAQDFQQADVILKNPGVRPDSPYLTIARKHGVSVTGDLGIFFNRSPATIIGVTGTRGKSTTCTLLWKFLKTKYKRVFLAGNIRKSVLELLPHLKKGDLVVLELSSFQLEDLHHEQKSPQVAILINIMRDHLNWHKSMADYIRAKSYIFRFQNSSNWLFANGEDARVKKMASNGSSHIVFPKLPAGFGSFVDMNLGAQYRAAVSLAIAAAQHFGVSLTACRTVLKNFHGLDSRGETVGTVHGIHFINDTTATTPDATIAALKRFRPQIKKPYRLILIAGGQDKKLDFKAVTSAIKKYADSVVLLPGTATEKIKKHLAYIKIAASMQDAVHSAYAIARAGDWIILSPGAASFGLFLNEFDRGAQFVKEVKKFK